MTFWESVGSTIIALLVVGAIGSVAALGWKWFLRRIGKQPDFVLQRRDKTGTWELRRTRRKTAFEVRFGTGMHAASDLLMAATSAANPVGDIRMNQRVTIGVPEGVDSVWFTWIDRDRRISRSVSVTDDDDVASVVAAAPDHLGHYQT